MKHHEKVTRTETYDRLVRRTCDLCGRESTGRHDHWDAPSFDVDETEITVTVKQREGSSYPEGGSGTKYEIDLCPDCFKDKLIPWLISQGAKIKQEEWDW